MAASLTERIAVAPKPAFLVIGAAITLFIFLTSGPSGVNYEVEIPAKQTEVAKKRDLLAKTKLRVNERAKFEEEMQTVSQTFRLALEYLPTKLDTQDLLRKIYSEARTAGVELAGIKPKDAIVKDFYDELPMDVQVRGTYTQLTNFLANVSKIPRIININNIEIKNPKTIDGVPFVELDGTLVAYRYKEAK